MLIKHEWRKWSRHQNYHNYTIYYNVQKWTVPFVFCWLNTCVKNPRCRIESFFHIWSVTVQHKLFDHDPVVSKFSNLQSVNLSYDSSDVDANILLLRSTQLVSGAEKLPPDPLQRCYMLSLWEDTLDIDLLVLMRLDVAICRLSVYHPLRCPIILCSSTIGISGCFPPALPVLHPSSLPHFISFPQHAHSLFSLFPFISLFCLPCVFTLDSKEPGVLFHTLLHQLFLFCSVCVFGRLPFNQRVPASCVSYSKLQETPLTRFEDHLVGQREDGRISRSLSTT